ncbi:hypothetical protein Tco_0499876 [Tanacetum coccineum]
MWSQVLIVYDKHALWGISHWGRKCQQFFGYVVNRESARDVYSRNRIIGIKKLTIVEWHNYKYLEWITVRRDDDKLSDLKRKTPYTAYSNPRGFIYQNKDKKNILICIDELHKFSDGILNDVRSALDDTLKRIRMKYLPQREVDRERARAMIQAIDRQLRNKRIIRSLEKFIGGRLYGGDLRLLEKTI